MFITKEVAQGIQELHRNGIVHGYINLDNIELGIDGMWKISIRSLILKTFYLSPEFNLKYIKGTEGDIFSLGTAFYKMMFGIFPYSGKTKEQIISNIKNK
jgi:serine/threonine protein kinase